jgi:hypothetical protein
VSFAVLQSVKFVGCWHILMQILCIMIHDSWLVKLKQI